MVTKEMMEKINGSSSIRAMFEEGARLKKQFGDENVFDFSLGNPSVPAPDSITEAVKNVLDEEVLTFVHGYMPNPGYEDVRDVIADHLNRLHGTAFSAKNIVMTVGAAGGLNVVFKTILEKDDEVIAFAPFFGEYISYAGNYGGKVVTVPPDTSTFQPDFSAFEKLITEKTKAVIINTPNNPTGVVYSENTLRKIGEILEKKCGEFGTDIYLISDEPYRELVYDGAVAPYVTKYYDSTIVAYSYSKSLSLPGERIGYLVIPDEAADSENLIAGAGIATRILGFVNAPSLMQRIIKRCVDAEVDVSVYDKNRSALYEGLKKLGLECIKPEGAFYLFVKSPIEDEKKFCDIAKKYNILMVAGSVFACPGYVRLAYCVSYDTIVNSLPKFEELMKEIRG